MSQPEQVVMSFFILCNQYEHMLVASEGPQPLHPFVLFKVYRCPASKQGQTMGE